MISWLHFSDFHFGASPNWEREVVLSALRRDVLLPLAERGLSPDLVFVAGDVASTGHDEEYEQAKRFFSDVAEITHTTPEKDWFIVPGNHDIDRRLVSKQARRLLQTIRAPADVNEILTEPESLRAFAERLKAFYRFTSEFMGPGREWTEAQPFVVEQVHVDGCPMAILGLNSTWAAEGGDDDQGRILVGEYQVREALSRMGSLQPELSIALLHHPLDWLRSFDQDKVEKLLFGRGGVNFLLRGHLHRGGFVGRVSPDAHCIEIASGACWQDAMHPHGVVLVQLDLVSGRGSAHMWRYSSEGRGFWAPDNFLYENMDGGVWNFELPKSWHCRLPAVLGFEESAPLTGAIGPAAPATSRLKRSGSLDQSLLVDDRTETFVGRRFVFDRIDAFLQNHARGYFLIRGDPGIGKTSLLAKLAKDTGAISHFNVRAEGINTAAIFLRNVTAKLVARFNLESLLPQAGRNADPEVFKHALDLAAVRLAPNKRILILVDALDEVDNRGGTSGSNILHFPKSLPKNVFLVATLRRGAQVPLVVDCEQAEFLIAHDSAENDADIREYLRQAAERQGIRAYLKEHNRSTDGFIDQMVQRSEGNFMYIRNVLPEIESGEYSSHEISELPLGLHQYYEDHWGRMRSRIGENSWYGYYVPIIVALAMAEKPVSSRLIAKFACISDHRQVVEALRQWKQFLHESRVPDPGSPAGSQTRYCLYHASFGDFLRRLDEVAEVGVNLGAMDWQIVEALTAGMPDEP